MTEFRLYLIQRVTAALLLGLGLVHLGTILSATEAPLSAADILARTRASALWPIFYGVFVLAAATHAAIGLRTIAREWLGWRRDIWAMALWLALTGLGLRAVWGIA
jgi:fumarate reductase subunit C